MSVPGIVQSSLGDEQVAAEVALGGEDALYVTPTRTLIYRADGLLSDESVREYSHDAERIDVSEGRRKSTVALDYGIEGTESFKVPTKRLHDALHPVLAGVLNGAGITDANEQVIQTYQFGELTLVITSARVVKHVGEAVWDEDFEQYHFADATRLDVEEGNVSSQIIIEANGRPERIKTPTDRTREVRERIERTLLSYHDVATYEEFAELISDDAEGTESSAEGPDEDDVFGGGVEPLGANPPELDEQGRIVEQPPADPPEAEAVGTEAISEPETEFEPEPEPDRDEPAPETGNPTGFADSGFESASGNLDDPVEVQLRALTETVERQNELLERQRHTIERLIDELSRGR